MAKPSDIGQARNISNGAKRYWMNHLCKYRNAQNLAWPKLSTAAADLVISERSIQNHRRELIEANWICLPNGDAGERLQWEQAAGLLFTSTRMERPAVCPESNRNRGLRRQIKPGLSKLLIRRPLYQRVKTLHPFPT
ncbi:MAG: helix-turn-helix domain-containing protein [Bryobacteraceae bacterium]